MLFDMDFLKIVAIAIISAMLISLLKQSKPEIAVLLGVAVGIIVVILVVDELYEIILSFYNIAEISGIAGDVFALVLKIVGIGYLAEFSASVCADSGCKSIGDKILFSAKIVIMILALPIIKDLFLLIMEILL